MITPAGPGAFIRRRKQCIDFRPGEKGDQSPGKTFAGNGEHALDLRGLGRRLEGRIEWIAQ